MNDPKDRFIKVKVRTNYIESQSSPGDHRYVFAYTITIQNDGQISAKLLTRHWIITDGNGKVQEVRGEGVVGEQPELSPGESYEYTSGTMIETSVGTMGGSYQMIDERGNLFDAQIPEFVLSVPRTLH
jgi:ApaG protein